MNVDEMTDEQLDEILFMRCKEYDDKVRADLMDRMAHMSDNPKALLKHFAHLVEVFNNQVWLIHIYREFISAINKEIDAQCNAAKSQGAKLDAGNLTKVMDEFNKQLNEARDLCKRCEPDSFMKMGIFKITDVKTNEQPDLPVFKTPRDLPKKPDFTAVVSKGPLNEIHARLAVKDIHDKIEKTLGNITGSCVARTRPIKSESRLLTDWQTEILEIMEANGVPEENIGKVLDLI